MRTRNLAVWALFAVMATGGCSRAEEAKVIRKSVIAGSWYPGRPAELREQIDTFLKQAEVEETASRPLALISPHAGYRYSGACAAFGYKALSGRKIDRVIVLAPSHRHPLRGGSIATVTHYETPLGLVPLDRKVCDDLLKSPAINSVALAHSDEHSLEIQLPFLQVAIGEFALVPIVIGDVDEEIRKEIAARIAKHVDERTVIIASSDFTHHGPNHRYTPFKDDVQANIHELDGGAIDHIIALDATGLMDYRRRKGATICGCNPISVLLEALPATAKGKLLKYYTSYDIVKDDPSSSVSYASILFTDGATGGRGTTTMNDQEPISEKGKKTLLDVARKSVEAAIRGEKAPHFDVDEPELQRPGGAFVTLKNGDELRGCIGRFVSDEPIHELIAEMAVAAATQDYRFAANPITAKELPELTIDISALSPMQRIENPLDIELGVHGIYIRRGNRSGTYLPQVATEHKMSKIEFLSSCCAHKAGLPPDAWKDKGTEVYVYTAQVFEEEH